MATPRLAGGSDRSFNTASAFTCPVGDRLRAVRAAALARKGDHAKNLDPAAPGGANGPVLWCPVPGCSRAGCEASQHDHADPLPCPWAAWACWCPRWALPLVLARTTRGRAARLILADGAVCAMSGGGPRALYAMFAPRSRPPATRFAAPLPARSTLLALLGLVYTWQSARSASRAGRAKTARRRRPPRSSTEDRQQLLLGWLT